VDKSKIPSHYQQQEEPTIVTLPDGRQVRRTVWATQSNEGKPVITPKDKIIPPVITPKDKIIPPVVQTKDPVAYANTIKELLSSGKKTISDLVNEGKISKEAAKEYMPFEVRRDVYTEELIEPKKKIKSVINNPANKQTVLYGGANAYRKNVVEAAGNGYQAYDLPDETGNYTNNAKRVYAIGDKIIDPIKSTYDSNNKIIAHFTGETLPSEGIVNYIKPSDDGVTKINTDTVNSFLQPGSSVNRNNFGGGGVNKTTVVSSKNTETFVAPKYDSNGKLITNTPQVQSKQPAKEVGKMYSAPSFKKGGVIKKKMKKCLCGCVLYKNKSKK
jgi:polyhydroxyalkanoate synthesis regulator phasin